MKWKMLLVLAALSSLCSVDSVLAQSRYNQAAYRSGPTRQVGYAHSHAMMGDEGDCNACGVDGYAGYGSCDACYGRGCGRCCRPGLLRAIAGGVGRVADGIGATLDCLFPCGGSCCEPACCAARPCGRRACMRRGWSGGCGPDCGGCSDCTDGGMMHEPYVEEHEAGPAPTAAPEPAPKGAHYRSSPAVRPTATRSRNAAAPKAPARPVRTATIPASAEFDDEYAAEERAPRSASPSKAPRTLMVRPQEANRLTPPRDADEEYETQPVRTAGRVPTNPLRSR